MGKAKIIGFNAKKLQADMLEVAVEMQNQLLIEYAMKTINEIANKILSYPKGNGMVDEGNLLDSLCWGVSYNGKLVGSGFFRPQEASNPSYLHDRSRVSLKDKTYKTRDEWVENVNAGEPVFGHQLAETYITKFGKRSKEGRWSVFFGILAPYWGYWEKGFHMKGRNGTTFMRFIVMSEFYDKIKTDLKPARTRLSVSVAKYASKSLYSRAKKNYYGR
jgi:hypothetical protein